MPAHRHRRAAVVALLPAIAQCFYLPGVAVHEYQQDERVDIKVNKITSTKTQLVCAAAGSLCHPPLCTLRVAGLHA